MLCEIKHAHPRGHHENKVSNRRRRLQFCNARRSTGFYLACIKHGSSECVLQMSDIPIRAVRWRGAQPVLFCRGQLFGGYASHQGEHQPPRGRMILLAASVLVHCGLIVTCSLNISRCILIVLTSNCITGHALGEHSILSDADWPDESRPFRRTA
jgi:hypothetical protein